MIALLAIYRRWRERRKRIWDANVLSTYYYRQFRKWYRQNHWRLAPEEGWHLGYNCSWIPLKAIQYIEQHGHVAPRPTYEQIASESGVPVAYLRQCI